MHHALMGDASERPGQYGDIEFLFLKGELDRIGA
jgi:hypothetical protein